MWEETKLMSLLNNLAKKHCIKEMVWRKGRNKYTIPYRVVEVDEKVAKVIGALVAYPLVYDNEDELGYNLTEKQKEMKKRLRRRLSKCGELEDSLNEVRKFYDEFKEDIEMILKHYEENRLKRILDKL